MIEYSKTSYVVINPRNGEVIRSANMGSEEGAKHGLLQGETNLLVTGILIMEYWKYYFDLKSREFVLKPEAPSPHHAWDADSRQWVDQRELEDFKRLQLIQVNSDYEKACTALTAGYPSSEIATWANQQRDAEAWEKDSEAETPFIDAIADARGIDRLELLQKTLDNVRRFLSATAQYTGTRQRLRDEIAEASTSEEVLAVQWPDFNSTLE